MRRFTFGSYLCDKWPALLIEVFGLVAIWIMLSVMGLGISAVVFVVGFAVSVFFVILVVEYVRRRAFWNNVEQAIENSQRVSDIAAYIDDPTFLEGAAAYEALDRLLVLANNELTQAKLDSDEYRNYVELWIHETKTPLAAAKLTAQRISVEGSASISSQLERVESQIEQALYYARSVSIVNDYEIHEIRLVETCREACKRNARFLIDHGCTPSFHMSETLTVLTDEPWLLFMLSQVVVNSAKYGAKNIKFSAWSENEGTPHGCTLLEVADDGCGICEADVPRVFDRGFTGTNGRTSGTATGMGLYLVARMCESLGIGVQIASEESVGTRVIFSFPHNRNAH